MDEKLRYKTGAGIKTSIDIMRDAFSRTEGMDEKSKDAYLDAVSETFAVERMKDKFHTIYMPIVGLILVVVMIFLAFLRPFPSAYQRSVFAIGIAIFAGLGAALIPGYFEFKFKGLVRAGGALGVFALVYLVQPNTFYNVQDRYVQKITVEWVPTDTTAIQSILIDFDPNATDKLCHYVATQLSKYTGDPVLDTAYTCYRTSDGMIYSDEKCHEFKETKVLVIANMTASVFSSKRAAYLHFLGKFPN